MSAVNEIREGLNGFKGAVRLKVLFFVDSHPFFLISSQDFIQFKNDY